MKLIKSDAEYEKILRDTGYFRCTDSTGGSWGDLCVLGPEVLGVYLGGYGVEGVLFSKEYAAERKQRDDAEKQRLEQEIQTIREYLGISR